jgi:hypothetical protein
MNEKGMG